MTAKRTIVVVGGGIAGVDVVRTVFARPDAASFNVVLITSRPHLVYLLAALRMVVDKDANPETVFFSYDRLFAKSHSSLKIGTVSSIEANAHKGGGNVVLKDGEKVSYDSLVLATGSLWEGPLAFPEEEQACNEHVQTWRNRFQDAKNIVIAGGGAVGLELAGEIRDVYPAKDITIVHGDELLLNGTYPDAFRKDVEARFRNRGIKLILSDYIDDTSQGESSITTRSGKHLVCDLLVPTRGGQPNTSFVTLEPSPLTEKGFVKVTANLQVESYPGIFAAGDIIAWPEVKQFSKVKRHVPVVVENVLAYLTGAQSNLQYKGARDVMILTNGKSGGASYFNVLWGLSFGDRVTRIIKSKDLMVERSRKALGLS